MHNSTTIPSELLSYSRCQDCNYATKGHNLAPFFRGGDWECRAYYVFCSEERLQNYIKIFNSRTSDGKIQIKFDGFVHYLAFGTRFWLRNLMHRAADREFRLRNSVSIEVDVPHIERFLDTIVSQKEILMPTECGDGVSVDSCGRLAVGGRFRKNGINLRNMFMRLLREKQ